MTGLHLMKGDHAKLGRRGADVLVQPEAVVWVVRGFDACQPVVVRAVAGTHGVPLSPGFREGSASFWALWALKWNLSHRSSGVTRGSAGPRNL